MTTPLEQFTNARVLWDAPGGRGGPEVGFQELPGQRYVLGGFLKQVTASKRAQFVDTTSLQISTEIFQGYITGFCPLPEGEDWRTYDYKSDPNWDITGMRPDNMYPPTPLTLLLSGGGNEFPGELMDSAGVFFDAGIGQIVRDVIGDRLIVKFERW